MTELYFPYKHIQTETFGEVTIPVAKIFLKGKQEETAIDVIVDTGAVISIFPKSLCDIIGLDFEKGQQSYVKTATGENIPIRIHKIKIRINKHQFQAKVAFSTIENVPYILGRLDILDKIEIKFEKHGTRFIIK
jgi:predicted aspartyl protease